MINVFENHISDWKIKLKQIFGIILKVWDQEVSVKYNMFEGVSQMDVPYNYLYQ